MLRINYTFICEHDGDKGRPVEVMYRGHSAPNESRVCYCTGKAVQMKREVKVTEPEAEKMPQ